MILQFEGFKSWKIYWAHQNLGSQKYIETSKELRHLGGDSDG